MTGNHFKRLWALAALLAVVAAAASPRTASAQDGGAEPGLNADEDFDTPSETEELREPETTPLADLAPEALPGRLDAAFEELLSEDEAVWSRADRRVRRLLRRSFSPSAELFLERAETAAEAEKFDLALTHLTDLVTLYPEFAEGWRRRSQVHLRNQDIGAALADLYSVISLEPRHFEAYLGLGLIFARLEDPVRAKEAFERALEIHPNLEEAQQAIERLGPAADGREA